MGGDREAILESSTPATPDVSGTVGGVGGNRIRIHQSAGEVHFHDDKAKLKAAVPVAEWWKAWDRLRSQPGHWSWIDSKNKSCITVETQVQPGEARAAISLKAVSLDTNFAELNNFTKR